MECCPEMAKKNADLQKKVQVEQDRNAEETERQGWRKALAFDAQLFADLPVSPLVFEQDEGFKAAQVAYQNGDDFSVDIGTRPWMIRDSTAARSMANETPLTEVIKLWTDQFPIAPVLGKGEG